jgi:hypothetical protein
VTISTSSIHLFPTAAVLAEADPGDYSLRTTSASSAEWSLRPSSRQEWW